MPLYKSLGREGALRFAGNILGNNSKVGVATMTNVRTHNKTSERDQSMVICSNVGSIDTEEFASREVRIGVEAENRISVVSLAVFIVAGRFTHRVQIPLVWHIEASVLPHKLRLHLGKVSLGRIMPIIEDKPRCLTREIFLVGVAA